MIWSRVFTKHLLGVGAIKIFAHSIKKRINSCQLIEPLDMTAPRISLEQWRALVAVVEAGGYA
ncbi:MAG: hypothetical protein WAW79_13155, partial [Steroidobacteraceae bacterium]